jgi:hypothetical protein
MHLLTRTVITLALLGYASSLAAQDPPKGQFPAGWKAKFVDSTGSAEDVVFMSMAPGWHITTGPAVMLFHPDSSASGNYLIESEIFLFPPGQHVEPWGVFVGGRSMDGRGSFTTFLLRRDGRFRIERVRAGQSTVLVDWTQHAAIKPHDGGDTNVRNVLAVDVGATEVRFLVNDQEVARRQKADLETAGVFGLSSGKNVNLHVTKLAVRH